MPNLESLAGQEVNGFRAKKVIEMKDRVIMTFGIYRKLSLLLDIKLFTLRI
jgi:hypothetical protein